MRYASISKLKSVQRWVTGYDSVNNWPYYDFGSCDSCPYTFPGGGGHPGWVPPGDWTLDNIRYVSWGANPAFPLPEIYTTDQSQAYQWQNISLYNYIYYNHTHMTFKGAMTQYQACQDNPPCPLMDNTAETGWEQLYSALDSDDRTRQYLLVNPMWSTDIQWRP